jgi:hypothetical protein
MNVRSTSTPAARFVQRAVTPNDTANGSNRLKADYLE